jgi:hypothetical protein
MDECTAPGIFWAYGNARMKNSLAYLSWNTNCERQLLRLINSSCSDEQREAALIRLEQARAYVDQQSASIVAALA